jgi:hypothetical protein
MPLASMDLLAIWMLPALTYGGMVEQFMRRCALVACRKKVSVCITILSFTGMSSSVSIGIAANSLFIE